MTARKALVVVGGRIQELATGDSLEALLGFVPGSVGAPGLYVVGDANTGIYSPGADQLAIALGGTQYVRFDPAEVTVGARISFGASLPNQKRILAIYQNGNVFTGLGMDAADAGVQIAGDGSSSANRLLNVGYYSQDGSYTYTERMRLLQNGNLLIGQTTDNGIGKLQVNGQITYNAAIGEGTNAATVSSSGTSLLIGAGSVWTNTRIYSDGSERMRVATGGNIIVGGATDVGYKLDVQGNLRTLGNTDLADTGGVLNVGRSVSTADATLQLGQGRTGSGYAYIDLVGDTTYTDYGLRLLRNNTGANADSTLTHRGTGKLQIDTNEAAPIVFRTTASERMYIASGGAVLIAKKLQVGSLTDLGLGTDGDIIAHRSGAPTTGVLYLGNTGGVYLYYDGTKYIMPNGSLELNGSNVWTAGNDGSGSGLDADLLDGLNTASANTNSTVMVRDASGRSQVTDPSAAQDIVTLGYFNANAASAGAAACKLPVRLVSFDGVSGYSYTISGGAVTNITVSSGVVQPDGVTTADGDRILIAGAPTSTGAGSSTPTLSAANGLYTVVSGSGTTNIVVARVTDADASAEMIPSLLVTAQEGGNFADTGWMLTRNGPITLNTTTLQFKRCISVLATTNIVNTAVLRDSSARFQAADPSAAQDVATRNFVESTIKSTATNRTAIGTGASADTDNGIFFGNASVVDLGMDGTVGKTFSIHRNPVGNVGRILTIGAGGASAGQTNLFGGDLVLQSGIGTGSSLTSVVTAKTPAPAASGTTDQILVTRAFLGAVRVVANNTATAVANIDAATANTVSGGVIRYMVEVFDGTNLQVEEGNVSFHAINKAGTYSNNVATKFGNQQATTSGTLTVTWTVDLTGVGGRPQLRVNANSSLTPSTGYPRITFDYHNLSQQEPVLQ